MDDRPDLRGKTRCSVESQRGPPIMEDQDDIARQVQTIEPSVEIANMIGELVSVAGRLRRRAKADEVWRKNPT